MPLNHLKAVVVPKLLYCHLHLLHFADCVLLVPMMAGLRNAWHVVIMWRVNVLVQVCSLTYM